MSVYSIKFIEEDKGIVMTVSSYIRAKNKILMECLGLGFDLVPEGQIEECEQKELSIASSINSCPYCLVFIHDSDCTGCPMEKARNRCNTSPENTWNKYNRSGDYNLHVYTSSPAYKPMVELINQYNRELK